MTDGISNPLGGDVPEPVAAVPVTVVPVEVLKCAWASDIVYRKYFNFDRSLFQIHQNGKPQKSYNRPEVLLKFTTV